MTLTKEQQIAALLHVLRPGAPAAWVIAACKIPRAERDPPHREPAESPQPARSPDRADETSPGSVQR
jgi:hypothetical protein